VALDDEDGLLELRAGEGLDRAEGLPGGGRADEQRVHPEIEALDQLRELPAPEAGIRDDRRGRGWRKPNPPPVVAQSAEVGQNQGVELIASWGRGKGRAVGDVEMGQPIMARLGVRVAVA
jgi:hypothetical protein